MLHLDPTSSGMMYTAHAESGRGGEGEGGGRGREGEGEGEREVSLHTREDVYDDLTIDRQ